MGNVRVSSTESCDLDVGRGIDRIVERLADQPDLHSRHEVTEDVIPKLSGVEDFVGRDKFMIGDAVSDCDTSYERYACSRLTVALLVSGHTRK